MAAKTREEIKYVLQSYKTAFGSEMGQAVLDDLAKFCNMNRTTVRESPHQTYFEEGKRAVYLHIQHLLNIPDLEEFIKRYDQPNTEEEQE